ncbi:unnamed protein product [Pleuronectes platessa]|uniref:Uncharacterized protein n=1 Tax=Pleuronectes platessa TaxID=8262 RepID=A0A9N7TK76_PLEPL|nr:unnamed protein product [Pleuronectes platessa]
MEWRPVRDAPPSRQEASWWRFDGASSEIQIHKWRHPKLQDSGDQPKPLTDHNTWQWRGREGPSSDGPVLSAPPPSPPSSLAARAPAPQRSPAVGAVGGLKGSSSELTLAGEPGSTGPVSMRPAPRLALARSSKAM